MAINEFDDNETLWAAEMNALYNAHLTDGIVSGCSISKGTGDFETDVTAGTVIINDQRVSVSSGTVTHSDTSTMSSGETRVDLVTADTSGTLDAIQGTSATAPASPAIPTNEVLLGFWAIAESDTQLTNPFDIPAIVDSTARWVEDGNSPFSGSGATSQQYTVAGGWDEVLIVIDSLVNDGGGNDQVFLQVDGDTGTNYDYSDQSGASTASDSRVELTNASFPSGADLAGEVLIDAAWGTNWTGQADLRSTSPGTERADSMANTNVASPLDTFTIGQDSGNFTLSARVFGRYL